MFAMIFLYRMGKNLDWRLISYLLSKFTPCCDRPLGVAHLMSKGRQLLYINNGVHVLQALMSFASFCPSQNIAC